MICAGIDLAWKSDRNNSAVAVGTLVDGRLLVDTISVELMDLDSTLEFLDGAIPTDAQAVIAIDAPLIITNDRGCRPCEREVSRRFGRHHAAAHSSNLALYPDPGSLRLVSELEARAFSMNVEPQSAQRRRGRWSFEVYPHPAHVVLFDRDRIIKYKKPPAARMQVGLREMAAAIATKLARAEPALALTSRVGTLLNRDTSDLKGRARKAHEDRLDALLCTYLAAYYWYWGHERNEMIGDLDTGNIVVPTHTWDGRRFKR